MKTNLDDIIRRTPNIRKPKQKKKKRVHTQDILLGYQFAKLVRQEVENNRIRYSIHTMSRKKITHAIGTHTVAENNPESEYNAIKRLEKKTGKKIKLIFIIGIEEYTKHMKILNSLDTEI